MKLKRIYFDYAATTPVDPRVLAAMKPYFLKKFGNASSLHGFGQEAKEALEESRKKIAKLINAEADEIIFTSGGTESDNIALQEGALANRNKGRHIITTKIEHPAILETCKFLEKKGFKVTYLDVDKKGMIRPEDVKKTITDKTILVSIMHANNEIGSIQPIKEIGRICREKNILFHTDAVQTFGKTPIDVKEMNISLLSASSHKICGPKGVGMLFFRRGINIHPLIYGGGQESGARSGTENISGIVGFAKATEISAKTMTTESKRLTKLRDKLIKGVLNKIPGSYLNGHPKKRLSNNVNFRFDFVEGESMVVQLDMLGIAVSTGSACSSTKLEPSHVLLALGLKHEQAHGSLRLTLGRWSKESEIDYLLQILPSIIKKLREISPFKKHV
ncbi:MAG: cysteine desulfurase NifS [Parcubacteria group bacterium]